MKEEELLTKDKRLESLRDRNIADSEQLELVLIMSVFPETSYVCSKLLCMCYQELTTLSEKYSFEVSAKEEMVRKLEVQYKRYLEIEKENNALRETVERLQLQMENDRNEHGECVCLSMQQCCHRCLRSTLTNSSEDARKESRDEDTTRSDGEENARSIGKLLT